MGGSTLSIFEKIIRGPVAIKDKIQRRIWHKRCMDILDNGERFDPDLGSKISWEDHCHLERYIFAAEFIHSEDTVVDVACGTGYGTRLLGEKAKIAIGVDISSKAIEYAKQNNNMINVKFFVGDFFGHSCKADIIVSFETIEHLKNASQTTILQRLDNIAGKKIIGSVPYMEEEKNNIYHTHFKLDEKWFDFFKVKGSICYYYQLSTGKILSEKPITDNIIQNLLFVFERA
jgi:SAM-dependent methyltransferase